MHFPLLVYAEAETLEMIIGFLDQTLNVLIQLNNNLFKVPEIASYERLCLIRENTDAKFNTLKPFAFCVFLKKEKWLFEDIRNKKIMRMIIYTVYDRTKNDK